MRAPPSIRGTLLKIGAMAGGPGYATDPCSRVASNIGELSQLGDSERLQEELRRKRDLCDCRAPRMHNAALRQPKEPALDLSPSPGDEVKTTHFHMYPRPRGTQVGTPHGVAPHKGIRHIQ